MSSSSPSPGGGEAESHRIYWQQWLSTAATSSNTITANVPGPGGGITSSSSASPPTSPLRRHRRRQLTTSSAAVRISPHVAKAKDVTSLLRKTLNLANDSLSLPGDDEEKDGSKVSQDSLVLVGTIHVPQDYVVYEHEHDITSSFPQHENPLFDEHGSTFSQPFHLVKTLHPDDNPLKVRDEMMKHLNEKQNRLKKHLRQVHLPQQDHSPSIQWFYVPGFGSPSIIPNCIELEGYATTMEDGNLSDDDEEEILEENYGMGYPGISLETDDIGIDSREGDQQIISLPEGFVRSSLLETSTLFASRLQHHKEHSVRIRERRESREWRRYLQISQSYNANPHCLAGYLLKQSSMDKHVWRKVYCLLTEDYMWYVHRIRHWWEQESDPDEIATAPSPVLDEAVAMAPKHVKISLSQALLLEPNEEFERSPLHRVPHAFQLVDGKGITHSFRASSKSLSRQWIQTISSRLSDCYENSFLENAELIIAEETMARNQRYKSIALDGLLPKGSTLAPGSRASSCTSISSHEMQTNGEERHDEIQQESCHRYQTEIELYVNHSGAGSESLEPNADNLTSFRAQVVRLGLDIAEYREGCRHIQAKLLTQVGMQSDREEKEPQLPLYSIPIRKMVQESWHCASELLGKATQLASLVQIDSGRGKSSRKHSSRSLDTLCHHVEFVITGQMRRRSNTNNNRGEVSPSTRSPDVTSPSQHHHHDLDDPPPIDLFDRLLLELQHAAAL